MLSTPADLARSALDAAPDAMIIIDAAGIIRFTNRQVSALFGYAHDEIIGQRVEMLMPERFALRHVGHRDRYVNNVRVRPMGVGPRPLRSAPRRHRISSRDQPESYR